jgi:uncharacterized damage-inducible protein DinB
MGRSQIAGIRQKLNQSRYDTLQVISKIDDEAAHRRLRPDAWNIKDHVAHLMAMEEAIIHFAYRILAEDRPVSRLCFDESFDRDVWNNRKVDERAGYTWIKTVCALEQTRTKLLDLLEQIPDNALTRVGSHPVWGEPVTLASILRIPYRHERGHRDEIDALRARSARA